MCWWCNNIFYYKFCTSSLTSVRRSSDPNPNGSDFWHRHSQTDRILCRSTDVHIIHDKFLHYFHRSSVALNAPSRADVYRALLLAAVMVAQIPSQEITFTPQKMMHKCHEQSENGLLPGTLHVHVHATSKLVAFITSCFWERTRRLRLHEGISPARLGKTFIYYTGEVNLSADFDVANTSVNTNQHLRCEMQFVIDAWSWERTGNQ